MVGLGGKPQNVRMMRGLFFQHGSLNRARAVHNARTPVSWGVSETQLWLKTIMVPSL